jgi:hypothetical protein
MANTKLGNLFTGCGVFIGLGVIGSFGMAMYVRGRTEKQELKDTYTW